MGSKVEINLYSPKLYQKVILINNRPHSIYQYSNIAPKLGRITIKLQLTVKSRLIFKLFLVTMLKDSMRLQSNSDTKKQ